jgi:hypothetical protein
MSLGDLLNKSVPFLKGKVKRIHQISSSHRGLQQTLLEIYSCYELATGWEELSPTDRILSESLWTKTMLQLLSIGNSCVMHSIRYRLREQAPEEDEEEN